MRSVDFRQLALTISVGLLLTTPPGCTSGADKFNGRTVYVSQDKDENDSGEDEKFDKDTQPVPPAHTTVETQPIIVETATSNVTPPSDASAGMQIYARIKEGVKYGDDCVAMKGGDLAAIVSYDAAKDLVAISGFCNAGMVTAEISGRVIDKVSIDTSEVENVVTKVIVAEAPKQVAGEQDVAAHAASMGAGSCSMRMAKILRNQITPMHNNCRKPQEPTTDAKRTELTNKIEALAKAYFNAEVTNWNNAQNALAGLYQAQRDVAAAYIWANNAKTRRGGFLGATGISDLKDLDEKYTNRYESVNAALIGQALNIQAQIAIYQQVPYPSFDRSHSKATYNVMSPICAISKGYVNNGGRLNGVELAYVIESYGAVDLDVKFAAADYPVLRQKTGPNDYQGWGGIFKVTDVENQDIDVTELPFSALLASRAAYRGLWTAFVKGRDSKGVVVGDIYCTFMQGLY